MSKMKRFAAMTAALLISASTMGYLPQDSIKISNVTANAAEEEITSVEINETNFPDSIFRQYVAEEFDINGDSVLSDKEIAAVTKIDVYDMGISDLTGIEYFENLAILECMFNKLTTLDISKNTALIELNCYHNQLTSLDVSNNTALEQLYCTNNQLTSINVSNNIELKDLRCNDNQLEIIDVSSCPALTRFECNSNQLTSLDLSNNTALKRLTTDENEYEIALTDNTFDLSTLPTGFDISKTSEWTNATVKGNILTIEDVTKAVTYKYDFGNEHSEVFTLVSPKTETPATTTTAANTTNPTTTTTTFATPSYSWHLNVYPYDKADTIYEIGEELDYSTICVYGYGGGEDFHADIPYISLDRCNLTVDASEFDNTKPGTYTIYVKWYDAVDSFEVTVIDPDNPTAIPGVEINETNFPDPVFRQYLAKKFDKNTDGRLSDKEIADVTGLYLGELGISDLTGIQHFENLQTLSCSYNDLTQLDISENKSLTHLYCENNNLTTLDTSNNVLLSVLDCHNNKLTKLDFSNNPELKAVWCCDNQLTSLDVSHNTLLSDLACSNNQLASIDLSNTICKEISDWGLLLYGNKHRIKITDNTFDLSTLPTGFDISKASEWTNATVEGNILTIEDITKKVTYTYDCGLGFSETFAFVPYNDASEMDVEINEITFPDAIFRKYIEENFDKDGNKILSYDELVKATFMEIKGLEVSDMTGLQHFFNLQHLYCSNNRITSLDVSNNTELKVLSCYNNQITSLDLSNNPALTSFSCDDNKYKIALTNNTFDLSTLPGGFDISKASDWKNAIVKDNILTVIDDTALITYSYKCGEEVVCFNLFTSNFVGETFEEIEIDNNNFPDDVFRQYVAEEFDENNDLALSYDEVMNVTYISLNESNLYDLTGIQYFKNLSSLWCYDNNLTTLDVSNNTELKILACSNNQLTSLDVSNNTALTELYLNDNKLTSLDVSNNTALEQLYCTNNQLTSINVSNNIELKDLRCNDNQLEIIDVSSCPALTRFECNSNQLTSLDASDCIALNELSCNHNQLTSLNVNNSTALAKISCFDNNLTSLDLSSNTALTKLDCSDNNLTSLDVSNNTALTELNCISNAITSLDFSKNTALTKLYCGGNELTSLDLSNNTALKDWIIDFHISKIALTGNTFDLSTLPAGFDISKTSEWTNGTVDGNILTVEDASKWVTYKYDCGNGESETFTLIPTKSAETPENPPVSLGDINADGLINSSDATLILSNYSAIATGGNSAFSAEQTKAADINNDGKCDSIDASLILAYYAHTSTGGTGTIEEYISKANADEQLKALREKKESEVQLFAAAYIGCTDDMNEVDAIAWIKENSPVFCENYSFVKNIPSGQIAGTPMGELYCIVPFDENSTVAINSIVQDENGNGSYENVIYRSESGEPILLFCNNSGVDGDTMVTITDSDGNKDVWFPGLDEKLMMNCPYNANYDTFVYDFSQYQEILEKGHTSRKNSGWKLPTAADLRFTNWSGVDYRGSEVIGSYKIEFGEDTAYIKWVDGDEEHEFKDVEWQLEVEKDAAVVTFNFNEFAGILQYNFLLNETGGMLYTAINFTNEDTLDENLKLYRILDRYEYSEPIS